MQRCEQEKKQGRTLITGGAGFIGSHTADYLIQQHIPVTVFDKLSTGKLANLNLHSPLLRFVQGDVLDYPALAAEIEQCDAVLHLAALPSVPLSIEDPLSSHAVNLLGFLQVLEAIRKAGRPIRLVYASSSAVYGDTSALPCNDDDVLNTTVLSPYALQKVQNEQYAALYAKLYQLPSLGLRYFNVYGPRQDAQSAYSGVISRFIAHYEQEKPLTIFGDGQQSRDFIHVSDIARANALALQASYNGVLNIATGRAETIMNLLSYIEASGGQKAQRECVPPRLGDIRDSYATTQKAEQALHFRYQFSLQEGISHLMQHPEKLLMEGGK